MTFADVLALHEDIECFTSTNVLASVSIVVWHVPRGELLLLRHVQYHVNLP